MNFSNDEFYKLLEELKGKKDLHISNTYPLEIAHLLGGSEMNIDIDGGRDMDYHGEVDGISFYGSALYGDCTINLEELDSNEDENVDNENKSLKEIEEHNKKTYMLDRIVATCFQTNDIDIIRKAANTHRGLQEFFVWRTSQSGYCLVYAENENIARICIKEQWGDYNEIQGKKGFEEKQIWYEKYLDKTRIKFMGEAYIFAKDKDVYH